MEQTDTWIHQLRSDDVKERARAAEEVCRAGLTSAEVTIELIRAADDDDSVSQWATAALEAIETPPPVTAAELARLVAADHEASAYWAATLLGRIGGEAVDSESSLAMAVTNSNHQAVKERAAWALARVGVTLDETKRSLQSAAASGTARLKRLAEQALAEAVP
jgi:hypothetical protein